MKTIVLVSMLLLAGFNAMSQTTTVSQTSNQKIMKTYVIERDLPGIGKSTPADLKSISQTSCNVLDGLGPQIKWMHSYVTGDKIYCVYQAENEELIREHGVKGGFPVTNIMEVKSTISPATAER